MFSDPSAQEEETNADENDAGEDGDAEEQDGGEAGKDYGQTLVLPDNVQRMLSSMKVTRLDKVRAVNKYEYTAATPALYE